MRTFSSGREIGRRACHASVMALLVLFSISAASAQTLVIPGTGTLVDSVGDHFEDETWNYVPELPKGSGSLNKVDNFPAGYSANGRWSESTYRGQPCQVQRVATPSGGLKNSKGALLLRTLKTGTGRPSYQMQQDDLLCNINTKIGGYVPVTWNPNFVVRVYLPPFEQWEDRSGPSFGIRADLQGREINSNVRFQQRFATKELEQYWPGFFICHQRKQETADGKPSAYFILRAGNRGEDLSGPVIKQLGWWTIGMSFTGDGKAHYFASPGLDPLTKEDHLGSYFPHGFRAERFQTFFFNVVNKDDGKTWSTPWVVDDCMFYMTKK